MLRFLAALIAAAVGAFLAVVFSALMSTFVSRPVADGIGMSALLVFPVAAFVYVFRRQRGEKARRREVERAIEDRKEEAIDRKLPERARTIANGLGENGVWQSESMRVIGGREPRIDVRNGGAWMTVFAARFLPGREGQIAPDVITKKRWTTQWEREHLDPHVVSTRTVGAVPASWDVLSYIPGDWEERLDPLVDAAEKAALDREQNRFGL